MSLRFHLFVSDRDSENEDLICLRVSANIFLRSPRDGKVLLRSFASC